MSIEKIKELRARTGAGFADVKKALEASNDDIDQAIEWLKVNGIAKAAKKADRIAAEGSVFVVKNAEKAVLVEINSETDFVASNDKFIAGSEKIANAILNSSAKTNEEALALTIDGETIEALLTEMTATIGEKISFRRFAVLEGTTGIYKHSNGRIGTIVSGNGIDEETLKDVAMHAAAMNPEFLSSDEISSEAIAKETEIAKEQLADAIAGKPENVAENMIKGKVNKTLNEGVLLEQAFVKDPSKKVKDLAGSGSFTSFVRFEVGEGIEKAENNFAEEVAAQVRK